MEAVDNAIQKHLSFVGVQKLSDGEAPFQVVFSEKVRHSALGYKHYAEMVRVELGDIQYQSRTISNFIQVSSSVLVQEALELLKAIAHSSDVYTDNDKFLKVEQAKYNIAISSRLGQGTQVIETDDVLLSSFGKSLGTDILVTANIEGITPLFLAYRVVDDNVEYGFQYHQNARELCILLEAKL